MSKSEKKSMEEVFLGLQDTVKKSLDNTDLERVRYLLESIDKPTLVTGVGGSNVVSDFASKVLNEKNKIITRNSETRDLLYMNMNGYDNVLSCSYSGNNYGVDMSFFIVVPSTSLAISSLISGAVNSSFFFSSFFP